jgi:hypothetical protein
MVLPLFVLGVAAAWLFMGEALRVFDSGVPPIEKLTFERRVLDENGIHLKVRAGGSEPMTIAQVQVDEAYWKFTQEPQGNIERVASAWLHIPYPWVFGEAHKVKVVTKTGTTFEHEIAVAIATPKPHINQLRPQALVGAFALHNITEGIGIAAPILKVRPSLVAFVGLALLAGAPAIVGMWVGSLAVTPQWAGLALAIGAGAILQVIVEVSAYVLRGQAGTAQALSPGIFAGLALGLALMYGTAMLVKV